MKVIRKVALAYIKERKVIMVRTRDKNVFYNLGGKYEENETDEDCLIREVKEEVGADIDKNSLEFLHEFTNIAHGKDDTKLIIRLYKGDLLKRPMPSSEIAEIGYFNSNANPEQVSFMGVDIIKWLKRHKLID